MSASGTRTAVTALLVTVARIVNKVNKVCVKEEDIQFLGIKKETFFKIESKVSVFRPACCIDTYIFIHVCLWSNVHVSACSSVSASVDTIVLGTSRK